VRHIGWLSVEDNLARQAALDSTELSDAVVYPLRNLVELPTSRPTRLRNVYTPTVYLTFPGPVDVDTAAIAGHNLSKSAKVDVTGSTTWDGSDWHEEATVSDDLVLLHLGKPQSYQYWRIEFDDPANDYGFIQLGYLMMGEMTVPGYSVAPEWELADEPVRVEIETAAGATGSRYIAERRRVYVTLDGLSAAQMEKLRSMWMEAARREEPVLFAPDVEGGTAVFGMPVGDGLTSSVVTPSWRSATVEVVSDARGPILLEPLPELRAGEPLPEGWTFSRASTAYYKNRDLLLVQAAVDECRTAHYVLPGRPAVLLEDSSTNLVLYSEEFDNEAWSKMGATVAANATNEPLASPTGTMDKIIEDTSTTVHRVQQSVTITAGAEIALSVYAKAGERTKLLVRAINGTGTVYFWGVFDLSAGSILSQVEFGGAELYYAYIEPMGNGAYRCVIAGVLGTETTCYGQFSVLDDAGNASYAGDGTSGLYLWGAQLEECATATSYIPTTDAAASRQADYLTYAFDPALPNQPLTVYLRQVEIGGKYLEATVPEHWEIAPSGETSYPTLYQAGGEQIVYRYMDASGANYGVYGTSGELNDVVETRACLEPDADIELGISINGGEESVDRYDETGLLMLGAYEQLALGHRIDGTHHGVLAVSRLAIARGVHSLDQMRRR